MNPARTLIRGIAALAVLAVLTVGVPWMLLRISGSPVPEAIPTWDQIWSALTSRDDGTLLLGLLKYAAWAGWALFAASLAADLIARVRGISVPRLGPQQHLASGLVTAVVAIAVTLPAAGPAPAAPAHGPQQTISTTAAAHAPHAGSGVSWRTSLASTRSAQARTDHQASRFARYTVRKGDCLWDIAWNELGDPERWPELYDASRHIRQPDGQRITDPDHIEPGWTVLIPKHVARSGASARGHAEDRAAAAVRPTPPIVTPLHLPAPARPAELRTPLTIGPRTGSQAAAAEAGSLDDWETASLRHDQGSGIREGWRARLQTEDRLNG